MSQRQDKQRIYNSREWQSLRLRKLTANPMCEVCLSKGLVESARVVHHVVPIETATDYPTMRAIAFQYDNLQSLCFQCHSDIHKAMASRTKEGHKRAVDAALERWKQRAQTKPSGHHLS